MKRSQVFILFLCVLASITVFSGCSKGNKGSSSATVITATAPIITASPAPGAYDSAQSVVLSCGNSSDAKIYYTTDGTDPTDSSAAYSTPIAIAATSSIKAKGVASDGTEGGVTTFAYTIDPAVIPKPVIAPATTDITITDRVTITAEKGTIRYTIDSPDISESSTAYASPFTLAKGSRTIRAIAVYNGQKSDTSIQAYSVTAPDPSKVVTPVIQAGASPSYTTTLFTITCGTTGASIQYSIDSAGYTSYGAPFTLTAGRHIICAKAACAGLTDSDVASLTVDVQEVSTGLKVHYQKPSSWSAPQLYYYGTTPSGKDVTWSTSPAMTSEDTAHSCYVYTIDAVTSALLIFKDANGNQTPASGVAGMSRSKEGWYYSNNGTYAWSDTNPWVAAIPVITATPAAKSYKAAQSVTLAGSNGDDAIHYTVDGTTPTASSALFSAASPIAVSKTATIKALGVNRDSVAGQVYSFTYVIDPNIDDVVPVITASVAAGQYASAQTVSFTVSDNNASTTTAYYTMDGTEPTTSSPVYLQGDLSAGKTGTSFTVAMNESKTFRFLVIDGAKNRTASTFGYFISTTTNRDFREETVYFLMTDRFADGNSSNNTIWGDEYLPGGASTAYDYNEDKTGVLSYYHGGDFDGIINNLDYIKDMGFTAIWITPVVKQPEGRRFNADGQYEASAFHGYWGYDFDQIDPHLHSSGKNSDGWGDFDKLVAAVHGKGMKLMLDIVVNHGQPGDSVKGSKSKWASAWNKIIMDGKTWLYDKATDPLVDSSNPLTGFFSYPGTGGTWLIDLLDFNGNGPAANSAMPHLKNVYKKFIDHKVDAFRIDTVAYMSHDNWVDFTDEMYNYAVSKGNPYFYMVGEAWTGDRNGTSNAVGIIYGSKGTHFNMLDLHNSSMCFPGWMGNVFEGKKSFDDDLVKRIFGAVGDGTGIYDPTYLGTFVDNHDKPRCNARFTEAQYKNNLNYIYLFRGIPIVYYGTEALYSWSGAHVSSSEEDIVGRWMLGDQGIAYVKNNKPTMYKHIKMLNALRRTSEALRKGQQTNIALTGDEAVIKRVYNTQTIYAAMSKGAAFTYTLTGLDSGTYTKYVPDSVNGTYTTTQVTVSGGTFTLDVPANSFVYIEK